MKEIFKAKSFWIVFIAASVIIFISFLNFTRTYKSETDILIIPKNSAAVDNSGQIIKNISVIPHSLLFFEKLVQNHPEISIPSINAMPINERKTYWDAELKTKLIDDSGIIKIIVYDKNHDRAEALSNFASRDLITVASNYYNIKTDIDIRIIDRAITSNSNSFPLYILILGSVGLGFILTSISFLVVLAFPKKKAAVAYKRDLNSTAEGRNIYSAKEETEVNQKKNLLWEVPDEANAPFVKKASAPANLPMADDSFGTAEIKPEKDMDGKAAVREATEEEVKERLNMLLSGRL